MMKGRHSSVAPAGVQLRNLLFVGGIDYHVIGFDNTFADADGEQVSKIKLDKSLVRDTLEREEDTAVIEAVLLLAQGYAMTVLVEGVETAEQALRLHELGCRCGQGNYFGRPTGTGAANMAAQLVRAA